MDVHLGSRTLLQLRRLHLAPLLGILIAGSLLGPAGRIPRAQAAPLPQRDSTCIPEPRAEASPSVLLLGETTDIRLSFNATCPGDATPLHLVFVLDESGSMQGDPINEQQQAVKSIIRSLELPDNPTIQVAVVAYQHEARTLCKLMNDEGRLLSCTGHMRANGGTRIDRGILEALKVLQDGRSGLGADMEPNEVIFLTSDGESNTGCGPVWSAARRAKGQGVLVITVCLGDQCDSACMLESASSARYHFKIDSATQLVDIYDQVRRVIDRISLRRLTLSATLAADTVLVAGSDRPAAILSPDGRTLTWDLVDAPLTGSGASFRIRPLVAGHQLAIAHAQAGFTDLQNRTGLATFPRPFLTVFRIGARDLGPGLSLKIPRRLSAKAAKEGY